MPADSPERCNPADALIIVDCIALMVVGALSTLMGFAGIVFMAVAAASGTQMLFFGYQTAAAAAQPAAARRLMLASLVYLPAVLLSLAIDKI